MTSPVGNQSIVIRRRVAGAGLRSRAAFSLIELLLALAIIAMLAGFISAAAWRAKQAARRADARVVVNELVKSWTGYWIRYGEELGWPGGLGGNDDLEVTYDGLLEHLMGDNSSENYNRIPFFESDIGPGEKLLDPWGQPYHMRFDADKLSDSDEGVTETFRTTVQFSNRARYRND